MSEKEKNIKILMDVYQEYLDALDEYKKTKNSRDFSKSYKKYSEACKKYEKIAEGYCDKIKKEAVYRVRLNRERNKS